MSGFTIVAYRPAVYSYLDAVTSSKKNRAQAIVSLHICVHYVLKPLAEGAIESLLCKNMDKKSLLLHIIVAS